MLSGYPVLAIEYDVRVALRTKIDSLCSYGTRSSLLKTWNYIVIFLLYFCYIFAINGILI